MKMCEPICCQNGEIEAGVDHSAMDPSDTHVDHLAKEIGVSASASCIHGRAERLCRNSVSDGKLLAAQCMERLCKMGQAGQFSPQLLILIVSTVYIETQELVPLRAGIEKEFKQQGYLGLPLIVSAYRETIFKQGLDVEGAILICVATRISEVNRDDLAASNSDVEALSYGIPS